MLMIYKNMGWLKIYCYYLNYVNNMGVL
jgi:hypothetical protein